MSDPSAWVRNLAPGDEVAVHHGFFRVESVTPKMVRLSDGRRFSRDDGKMIGDARQFGRGRPWLDEAAWVRRRMRAEAIRSLLGTAHRGDCELTDGELRELCEVLARHGRKLADGLMPTSEVGTK